MLDSMHKWHLCSLCQLQILLIMVKCYELLWERALYNCKLFLFLFYCGLTVELNHLDRLHLAAEMSSDFINISCCYSTAVWLELNHSDRLHPTAETSSDFVNVSYCYYSTVV